CAGLTPYRSSNFLMLFTRHHPRCPPFPYTTLFRSWLWRRVEQQSTDLQRERELLSVVVTRGNVHRFDLQRERVFFHFVKEPRERRHAAERINATFQRHIVVRIPSPLRLAGTDADPALVRPAINRLEHL